MKKLLLGLSIIFLQTNCDGAGNTASWKTRGNVLLGANGAIHLALCSDPLNISSHKITAVNIALLAAQVIAVAIGNDQLSSIVNATTASAGIAETAFDAYALIKGIIEDLKRAEIHLKHQAE